MLNIKELNFSYNKKTPVLKNINVTFKPYEITVVLGENGAGKSTLFELIAGTLNLASGNIQFKTYAYESILYRKSLSYLAEWELLFPKITVWEHLQLMSKLWDCPFDPEYAKDLLKRFTLLDKADSCCDTLSKGMNQKLYFLGSIINKPSVILMDEPFTGLDLVSIIQIKKTLKDLAKSGTTVILSTHIISFAQEIADRILFLKGGEFIFDLSKEKLEQIRNEKIPLEEYLLENGYSVVE